jgi:hypothetical protein
LSLVNTMTVRPSAFVNRSASTMAPTAASSAVAAPQQRIEQRAAHTASQPRVGERCLRWGWVAGPRTRPSRSTSARRMRTGHCPCMARTAVACCRCTARGTLAAPAPTKTSRHPSSRGGQVEGARQMMRSHRTDGLVLRRSLGPSRLLSRRRDLRARDSIA